jgi:hypothetical protein
LSNADRVFTCDQTRSHLTDGDQLATSTGATICIGYGNRVISGGIYIDATRTRARAPQITGTATGT